MEKEDSLELSVIIPCLNEAESLPACLLKAKAALNQLNVSAEIIVCDNGSTDGSVDIARGFDVRVIEIERRGYGSALMGGIDAARGKFIIMGDADDSYDFGEIGRFLQKLREGYDLVQGCRMPSGGGKIMPGAMPWLHQYIGNPLFSFLAKLWFNAPIDDPHCGMRGFSAKFIRGLDMRCTEMEFAIEMIVKASHFKAQITQIPISLYPDKRQKAKRHLRTFRHGLRALRFMLLCAPLWLYWLPGLLLILAGVLGYVIALPGLRPVGINFDIHTLLLASLSLICGYQILVSSVVAQRLAAAEGLIAGSSRSVEVTQRIVVDFGMLLALVLFLSGGLMVALIAWLWISTNFGPLDVTYTMRWAIPGVTLIALGVQSFFSQLLLSVLEIDRL